MRTLASGSIDLKSLKVAGEPNKYITKISGDGIKIHDSQNQNSNYIQLTSNGMKVYKNSNMCFEASATELKASLAEAKDVFTVGYGSAIANKTETQILNSTSGVLDLTAIPFNTNFNLTFTVFFVGYSVTLGQSTTFENTKLYPSGNLPWNSAHTELWRQAAGYSGELLPSGSMNLSIGQPTPGEKQINYNITITGTGLTFDYATITAVWEESAAVKDQVFLTFGSREDGISKGLFSSAMGLKVAAVGDYSHAEGYHTIASGNYSHASGFGTQAIGDYSYSSGYGTKATIDYQSVFGKYNEEDSNAMFIIGNGTNDNNRSNLMVVGDNSIRIGNLDASHLLLDYHSLQMIDKEGSAYFYVSDLRDANGVATLRLPFKVTYAMYDGHDEVPCLLSNIIEVIDILDEDGDSLEGEATATYNSIENYFQVSFRTNAYKGDICSIVFTTTSTHTKAFTCGTRNSNYGIGGYSVALGYQCAAVNTYSIAEGAHSCAEGFCSHAEGQNTRAYGSCSHAEGTFTTAWGEYSHAEGSVTIAIGNNSHTEGTNTRASGECAHAEGINTIASGKWSHAQNLSTVATENYQTVIGKYNSAIRTGSGTSSDPYQYSNAGDYAFIIGNGDADRTANRSNALTVDWNGNVNASGQYENLYKITTVQKVIHGGINANSYVAAANITMTAQSGYNAVGIVGHSSSNFRVQPTTNYVSNNTTIFAGFANWSASNVTSDVTVIFYVLWLKATAAS